jgi:pilus assembly protein CpaE
MPKMDAPKDRILVVDDNKLIVKVVADKLLGAGFNVLVAGSAEEGLKQIESNPVDLVVSDVMMPGMDGYEFCRRIKANPITQLVPVIMLTARGDISEKVRGFEAGADDYLVKPFEPTELTLRIRALLARARAARGPEETKVRRAQLWSVFSLRGGAGRSSLAVNLAVSLAGLWNIEVALVDMAFEMDQDAMLLNLRPKRAWNTLAQTDSDLLDEDVVLGHLERHESGVSVLAAPPSPVSASLISSKLVSRVLEILGAHFPYVVMDLPPSFSETNLAALDASSAIFLMLTPELASLKAGRTALELFDSLGYSHDRIHAVLNWTFPKRGLPQRNIEDALTVPMAAVLPYEQTAFVDAINTGVPLVIGNPTLRPALEIQRLALQLSGPNMQGRVATPPTEMMQRVKSAFGR